MKLQGVAIIFIMIAFPMILVLSYYLGLQIDTIKLQTDYDNKLIDATYDSLVAFEINTAKDSKAYEYYECLSDEEKVSIMDTVRQIIVFYGNKYGVFNEKMDGTKEQIDRLYNEYFSYFD